MIRGVVNARLEIVVRLRISGPAGIEAEVDAVVDTGFTRFLTLPPETVDALGLSWEMEGNLTLADGSVGAFSIYTADVDWGGSLRTVPVSAVGDTALAGMKLLDGHELWAEVFPGGAVEIRPLP